MKINGVMAKENDQWRIIRLKAAMKRNGSENNQRTKRRSVMAAKAINGENVASAMKYQ